MTNDKDLKYTQTFKKEPNVPKTYEQFILEEKDLSQQDLYPELDLNYADISSRRGYGPMPENKKICLVSGCGNKTRFADNWDYCSAHDAACVNCGNRIPMGIVTHCNQLNGTCLAGCGAVLPCSQWYCKNHDKQCGGCYGRVPDGQAYCSKCEEKRK